MKFIAALVAALIVNLAFAFAGARVHVDAQDLPSKHTWEWWRIHSYLKSTPPPDIVLLGSSLIMIPVSVLDADYLKKDLDAVHHDRSQYMQTALAASAPGQKAIDCFNFAVPGGMISDDYMILRAILESPAHPKMIVVGITLRDFIESHVPCAASTTTFKYFRQFFNIDDIANLAMPEIWQKFDYWQSKFIYIVGQRLNLQVAWNQELTAFANDALGPSTRQESEAVDVKSSTNVAHNLKQEAEEGDFVLHAGQIYPYEDNSNEYKKRFSHPSKSLFNAEAQFMDKLLELAQGKGVKVLLVNMPLTDANMALMPAGFYQKYYETAQKTAAKYNCPLIDVNDHKTFTVADFRDTAHMNSSGGKKLIDRIVQEINASPSLAVAVRGRQEEKTGDRKLAGKSDDKAI